MGIYAGGGREGGSPRAGNGENGGIPESAYQHAAELLVSEASARWQGDGLGRDLGTAYVDDITVLLIPLFPLSTL